MAEGRHILAPIPVTFSMFRSNMIVGDGAWNSVLFPLMRQQGVVMTIRQSEPRLEELLNDPVLHVLLHSDGVTLDQLKRFLGEMKQRLRTDGRKAA